MRVLLLNQYYPPDVAPTGRFLHDVAQALVARGHEVQVLCSRGAYDGGGRRFAASAVLDGVHVRRLPALSCGRRTFAGKVLDYASFGVTLAVRLLMVRPRPDIIVALTTPPYLGVVAKLAATLRRTRHAHWIMDVYPDAMLAQGMIRRGAAVHRALASLTRLHLRGSAVTLAVGPDQCARLAAYSARPGRPDTDAGRTHWVALWADPDLTPGLPAQAEAVREACGWGRDELVLMYSGNMGLGHRFAEFLAAAEMLRDADGVRFCFAGGGRQRAGIARTVAERRLDRVRLLPYAAPGDLGARLAAADVHLVSQDPAWQGVIVPSKLQNIFAVGKPVIFIGAPHSCLAEWLTASGAGWVVPPGDIEALLRAIAAARDSTERCRRGDAGRRYAATHFDREANVTRIVTLIESAVGIGFPLAKG